MKPSLKEVAENYGVFVSGIAHRMIRNKELAREAAQEVWVEIITCYPTFRGDAALSTWIYSIARRTILRYVKKERIATLAELKAFRALPAIEYDEAEEKKKEWIKERCDWCLTALNHCLTYEARLIFIFRENVDLSFVEISQIMEMKEENVRKILSRSIRKISSFMRNTCPLYNPEGSCKCRISKPVFSIDLDKEYQRVRKAIRMVDFYRKIEKDLPRKNYWKEMLEFS
ncbi:MAG: sigma-70 family RNA polymerase sigma factor [Candidatus Azobacteroides sp.]|nr:sigma-70 family RNA polymerase sigma factor [Candidatus Azobacteroides sp.]